MNQQNVVQPFNPATRPVAVIGGGTLGSRIALMLASSGGEVRLYDAKAAQLEIAERYIDTELPKLVKERAGAVAGRVVFAKSLEFAIAETWMVVEAIPERLDLKKAVFGDLDRLAPQDAILASNSSSYPSSRIIGRVTNPSRVVNTHYYMPPEQIAVEVMSCGQTSNAVIADLMDRLPLFGLVPFHVRRESVGFIFNRIWAAVKRESLEIVEKEVSTPAEVDHIFQVLLGTPGGPFRLMDKVGLDVVLDIEEHYAAIRPELPVGPRQLLKQYIGEGRLGLKTGKGFYTDYPQNDDGRGVRTLHHARAHITKSINKVTERD
jgi:3-hydroxybutyryl-CoA dehydrogenase